MTIKENQLESMQVYPDRFGWPEGFRNYHENYDSYNCPECGEEVDELDCYCDVCARELNPDYEREAEE